MAKFGGIEVTQSDWEGFSRLLNSKIGVALLVAFVAFVALYLTVPPLEAIRQNTGLMAQSLQDAKQVNDSNHDMLVRMGERCDVQSNDSRTKTASAKGISK